MLMIRPGKGPLPWSSSGYYLNRRGFIGSRPVTSSDARTHGRVEGRRGLLAERGMRPRRQLERQDRYAPVDAQPAAEGPGGRVTDVAARRPAAGRRDGLGPRRRGRRPVVVHARERGVDGDDAAGGVPVDEPGEQA